MQKLWLKHKDKWWVPIVFLLSGEYIPKFINWVDVFFDLSLIPNVLKKIFTFLNTSVPLYVIILFIIFIPLIRKIQINIKFTKRGLRILDAKYGKDNSWVDITNELNSFIKDNKIKIVISNNIAGDPYFGEIKKALIHYKYDGIENEVLIEENEVLELPLTKDLSSS